MTSKERHIARYYRRKQKRLGKKRQCNFDTVFTYENLYKSYKKCRRNVAWKSSVQRYITQAPLLVRNTYEELCLGTFKSDGFYEFDINERGKTRHIKSVTIRERVVQGCLCDYALVPVLTPSLIHDNGASTKGKGYHFTINRLVCHLERHYRKHGTDGYILLFDFKKFFDYVSHDLCKEILCRNFADERIIDLAEHFIDMFGDVGIGLGSQISQILALSVPSELDHLIKEKLHIKAYGRYMDDGYLIHESKEYLQFCLSKIREMCEWLDIRLNENKTKIVKLSRGFTYLKVKFFITKSGKIIKKINRDSVTRERRKLKKLEKQKIPFCDVYSGFQSWHSYAMNFNSTHTRRNMCNIFNGLFIDKWIQEGAMAYVFY